MGKLTLTLVVVLFGSGCLVDVDDADVESLGQELAADNAIYNNGSYSDSTYDNGTFENGYAITRGESTPVAAWERPWARVWTGPRANGYSVAYSKRWGSTFFTNQWVQNATQIQYVDGNGTTCAHPSTRTGSALASTCSGVVQRVCSTNPTCCSSLWTQTCVDAAADVANDYVGTHATWVTGTGLSDGHSGCAALVNFYRPSCRASWTSTCVDDAFARCYARYVTRPRIESSRLVADACVEPAANGVPGCTNAYPGSPPGECCRRSLVLYGVYQDVHRDDPSLAGHGHKVQWSSKEQETTPAGATPVRATMVPDPCTGAYYFNGETFVRSCAPEHHLWQLAAPGKPFYPDVVNQANTTTGEWNALDVGHRNVRLRNVLVNLLTGLINTTGAYTIDLRYVDLSETPFGAFWRDATDTGFLPPASGYANKTELILDDTSLLDWSDPARHLVYGHVLCKVNSTRADTGAPACSTLDYKVQKNRGKDSTLRSIWELL